MIVVTSSPVSFFFVNLRGAFVSFVVQGFAFPENRCLTFISTSLTLLAELC
jgi:hypothetical protein